MKNDFKIFCECGHSKAFHMKGRYKCRHSVGRLIECSCEKFKLKKS